MHEVGKKALQAMGLGGVCFLGAATMGVWALTYPLGLNVAGGDATPVDEAASDPPSPKEIADETTLDELAKDAPESLRQVYVW